MIRAWSRFAPLLATSALVSVTVPTSVTAQTAQVDHTQHRPTLLDEIVVTATRREETVSQIPLSISAANQQTLDRQGIRNVADLTRATPGLTVTGAPTQGSATFAIRGISSPSGAATVGVYLDDVSVTKRQLAGGANINGSPLPALFDLDRIEVLRGPQGTLYGGSSQGGTIRFITPTPSLTDHSTYIRAMASSTRFGDPSSEAGVAMGGPLIKDELGFRVSMFARRTGGYIDHVDPYNPYRIAHENTNSGKTAGLRAALLWEPIEDFRVGVQFYASRDKVDDTSSYTLPLGTITTPERCTSYQGYGLSGGRPRLLNCASPATPITHIYPAQSYGPFDKLQPFQTLLPLQLSPTSSSLKLGAVTLDYKADSFSVKSISSYFYDNSRQSNYIGAHYSIDNSVLPPGATPSLVAPANPLGLAPNLPLLRYLDGRPYTEEGAIQATNERWGFSQELRFSSEGEGRLTWVAGIYFAHTRGKNYHTLDADYDAVGRILYNLTLSQRYAELNTDPALGPVLPAGAPCTPAAFASGACRPFVLPAYPRIANRFQAFNDTDIAAFADFTWHVTDKLNAIAGLRISRTQFDYRLMFSGLTAGYNKPTTANGGIVQGSQVESPVTPKFGLQYRINEDNQVYTTVSKGFRPGGLNAPISPLLCPGIALAGLTASDIPTTYDQDVVWSYEVGAKVRPLRTMQVNASIYRIDWSDVQTSISTAGCQQTYTTNAGKARSMGFDLEAQARVFDGLLVNAAIGYTDAEYTTTTTAPQPASGAPAAIAISRGDKIAVPPWTVSLGAQYNFHFGNGFMPYVRADYRYSSAYNATPGPGSLSYAIDSHRAPSAEVLNARIGSVIKGLDVSLFANNLLDSRDYLSLVGGRLACLPASGPSCSRYALYTPLNTVTTFRPREFGIQLTYRH